MNARLFLEPTLQKMTERGWLTQFAFFEDGRYALTWTDKGRERVRWLRELNAEFQLVGQETAVLMMLASAG